MLLVILILSAFLTILKPYEIGMLFTFLDILGYIVPPLAGIIFSDYYLVKKGVYKKVSDKTLAKWNAPAWITWAISIALVYMIPFGLPSLNGIILGAVLYTALMAVSKQRVTTNLAEEA